MGPVTVSMGIRNKLSKNENSGLKKSVRTAMAQEKPVDRLCFPVRKKQYILLATFTTLLGS
jgi:hypothetical protein